MQIRRYLIAGIDRETKQVRQIVRAATARARALDLAKRELDSPSIVARLTDRRYR